MNTNDPRTGAYRRSTGETDLEVTVGLDGSGSAQVSTGLAFLDHMLTQLSVHGGFDIQLTAQGDLEVDDHHTVEDTAIALGEAFRRAMGEVRGVKRFGSAYAPLDEALARVVVDWSGRPFAVTDLGLTRERVGQVATENVSHFFRSFAVASALTLHVDVLRGENDHHRIEAAFKAFALALSDSVTRVGTDAVPSSKGVL
jgi:imidazoleglycerol-phosphate dehydratase